MNQVVIVIPIYNKVLKPYEEVSLKQCFDVLKNYPVTFVCANGFDAQPYLNLAARYNKKVSVETFDPIYFNDIKGYNKLMMSKYFYKRFSVYNYILIHQTDAYIFRNELSNWCDLNYDYIGAPWLLDMEGWLYTPDAYPLEIKWFYKIFGKNRMQRTGNGGLSLRKTKSFIFNLSFFNFWVKRWKSNEDNFFSQCISILNPFFKIPPYKKSVQFSFDALPVEAYKLNNNKLPFGCHAFGRNDGAYENNRDFWIDFIPPLRKL